MSKPLVQITADDVGAVGSMDEAVKRLIELGVINSISIFVNGGQDLRWISSYVDAISIGLHLTFSFGKPISEIRDPSIVNSEGYFLMPEKPPIATADSIRSSIEQYLSTFENADYCVIRDECASQIDAFTRMFNKPPDFINVHHDLDNCLILKRVLRDCFSEWKTRSIKSDSNEDYLYLFRFLSDAQTLDESRQVISELFRQAHHYATSYSSAEVELVFHPGFISDELRHFSSYCDMRKREFDILSSSEIIVLSKLIQSPYAY